MKQLCTIKEYAKLAGISEQAVRKNKKLKTIKFEEITHVVIEIENEEQSPLADEIKSLKEKLKLERERKRVLKEKVNKFESKEADLLEKKEELKEIKAELKETREKLEAERKELQEKIDIERDKKDKLYENIFTDVANKRLAYKG